MLSEGEGGRRAADKTAASDTVEAAHWLTKRQWAPGRRGGERLRLERANLQRGAFSDWAVLWGGASAHGKTPVLGWIAGA